MNNWFRSFVNDSWPIWWGNRVCVCVCVCGQHLMESSKASPWISAGTDTDHSPTPNPCPQGQNRLYMAFLSVFKGERIELLPGEQGSFMCVHFHPFRSVGLFCFFWGGVRFISGLEFTPFKPAVHFSQDEWLIWPTFKAFKKRAMLLFFLCITVFQTFLIKALSLLT